MRLAHFSDIHVTRNPLGRGQRGWAPKRLTGTLNYFVGGRRNHFADGERRIRCLLEDIDAQRVDHALCTGDVTQMSYRSEFEACGALFGDRRAAPARYTVLPGNHDRYTRRASTERRFEHALGAIAPDAYPFEKPLGAVHLVALDVSRPTNLLDSSGRCGPAQLRALELILTRPALAERFVILALHYGFSRASGRPDRRLHGIRDVEALRALLDRPDVHLDLVLHGHMHKPFEDRTAGRRVICAGSATDLHRTAGYNIYEIDPERRSVVTKRRVWDTTRGAYTDERD